MPDVALAEGTSYTVVVDRRVEIRVVAIGDEYLRFMAECGPPSSNLDVGQLMALLNCNFAVRPSSTARVGICPDRGVAVVQGSGCLDSDDPARIRSVFDDVVALAERVLAILAEPGDGEHDPYRRAGSHGNYL
jgi:hypothetical protein